MTVTPANEFRDVLAASWLDGTFSKLTLGKPRNADPSLQNVFVRRVELKAGPHLSFIWRHDTRDITKNLPPDEAMNEIDRLLGTTFHSAHLFTTVRTVQLEFNKRGEPRLTFGRTATPWPAVSHDRTKPRVLPAESQVWLHALGVTNSTGVVREGMSDKHRQIHKYVELLGHLATEARLPADRPMEIADMGCGKGYLTFATHDYFELVAKRSTRVVGVEQRPDLVELGNRVAQDSGRLKLSFVRGTIQEAPIPNPDILIALHACDTATDDALARGLAAGSALIITAPCCQKELRPQLTPPPVLAPVLRHGIFQERHAEFATDALRALLLEWAGYDTKVFEFISTEHTAKNLMIAAIRRPSAAPPSAESTRAVLEFAKFYGITEHALARHLDFALA